MRNKREIALTFHLCWSKAAKTYRFIQWNVLQFNSLRNSWKQRQMIKWQRKRKWLMICFEVKLNEFEVWSVFCWMQNAKVNKRLLFIRNHIWKCLINRWNVTKIVLCSGVCLFSIDFIFGFMLKNEIQKYIYFECIQKWKMKIKTSNSNFFFVETTLKLYFWYLKYLMPSIFEGQV